MESLLKCRKFEIIRRPVEGTDGRKRFLEYVAHPGAVVVLPLLEDDVIIMLRQYRPTVDRELWELPAGTLDVPGEAADEAARRELEEEAGYRAGRLEFLCEFYPSPGVMNEVIRAYAATDLEAARQKLEPMERIIVETMKFSDALSMVRDGRILDAKTIITLLHWDMRRKES